jgi:dipeptidyl aminopeptidase/acylaminoacyl peptidase
VGHGSDFVINGRLGAMRRLGAVIVVLLMALAGCSGVGSSPPEAPSEEVAPHDVPETGPEESPTEDATPAHPVSLPALAERAFDGRELELGRVALKTATQTQYDVTYRSGDLTISGRLAVPTGDGPFPGIVLAHGYIDPAVYRIGQGMTRERAWFADNGYVAFHVDYRNHGASDTDPDHEFHLRLGYAEDVVNAVLALRQWDGPIDPERIAVGGRSMGGGVVYNVLVAQPGLVRAGVVWASISSDSIDNFEMWVRPNRGRAEVAQRIIDAYGDPADPEHADFWAGASARTFFERITEPVQVHHGTADDICPIAWGDATTAALEDAGVETRYEVYQGEGHTFGPQFLDSMERTARFLAEHLG